MVETHFDFKQLVTESRTPTEDAPTGQGTAVEFSPLFDKPAKTPPITSSEVPEGKVAIEVAMNQFTKVFTLWRPWEDCTRCRRDMSGDEPKVVLPEEGDYTCPHVGISEYKRIIDRCLSGAGVISIKEMFNLPNGARCVHLEWMEADEAALKKLKQQEEAKKKGRVWPPDVDGAFNKDEPQS
jgi:hypothetical protein